MGPISLKKQLLVILVVSTFVVANSMELSNWEVSIKNNLTNGQKLFVHCKSKDTDLGEKTLTTGSEFKWKFKVNIWGTTLYWCTVRKPNGYQAKFDAFWVEKKTRWLRVKCDNHICNWIVQDSGVYLKDNSENTKELIHNYWKLIQVVNGSKTV